MNIGFPLFTSSPNNLCAATKVEASRDFNLALGVEICVFRRRWENFCLGLRC